jgi:membrane-associated protein
MRDFFTEVITRLEDLAASPWFYLVIFGLVALDSFFPAAPSEALVIAGGVSAGLGQLELPLVILCAMSGAFLGDHVSYLIGRKFGHRIHRRAERKEKTANRLRWASNQIKVRGGLLLVTARFVPGGRTVLTLTAGATRQPLRWFTKWVAIAVVIWATYAATLGFVFGEVVKDNESLAFLAAFAAAIGITGIIELVRFVRTRRLRRRLLAASADQP